MVQQLNRRFCFTWNNYPATAEEQLRTFFSTKRAVYMVVGREIGESGTPHLQGYIHLKDAITFARFKHYFPSMHIEKAKGNAEQNKTYCSKDQDFFEEGTCPKASSVASKVSWKAILDAAERGDWDYLKTNHPRVWVTMSEKLISKRVPRSSIIDGETQNEWWYGATGTGKSKLAWEIYGDICYQKMLNKWWDGYDAQPVVIIEEWSPKNEVTASALKIWADRYPFTAQIKGGVLQKIRPLKIIVISNYRLGDCFPDHRDADPLARRFRQHRFPEDSAVAEQIGRDFLHRIAPAPELAGEDALMCTGLGTLDELLADTADDASVEGVEHGATAWLDFASIDDLDRLQDYLG